MKTSEHPLALFRLCLAGLLKRGSCWLLLLGLFVFMWVVPLMTPWDEQPQILQPARAQAAWVYLWITLFTWIPFQAASLGRRLRAQGLLEFAKARGEGEISIYLQMGAAIVLWLLLLVGLATGLCVWLCSPRDPLEARIWVDLLLQYAALVVVAGAPLCFLGVALGTRAGEVVAFLVPVVVLFCGLVAASWLAPLLAGSELALFRSAWVLLPHYHLADLTPRLVFKMGPLNSADFRDAALCLIAQGAALTLFGRCLFRTRS
jgi:hypothetical protein